MLPFWMTSLAVAAVIGGNLLLRAAWLRALPAGRQQSAFGAALGIAEFNAHQETVKLRLGERKRADLRRRVLRGDDEERLWQGARFALRGDGLCH